MATSVTGILTYSGMVSNIQSIPKRHKEFLERIKTTYPKLFADFTVAQSRIESTTLGKQGKWDIYSLHELFVRAFESGAVLDANGKFSGSTDLVTTILFLCSLDGRSPIYGLKAKVVKDKLIRLHINPCVIDHKHNSLCYETPMLLMAAQSYYEHKYSDEKSFPIDVSPLIQAAVYLQQPLQDKIVRSIFAVLDNTNVLELDLQHSTFSSR